MNPPKEIDDPKDKKPEDWDEKEKYVLLQPWKPHYVFTDQNECISSALYLVSIL